MRDYMTKLSKKLVFFILTILTALLTFLYFADKKEIWFCDEVYTYESANGFESVWPRSILNTWMTGDDVNAFLSADSTEMGYTAISNNLYGDHVPLYFWIFRTVSVLFFMGSSSKWIGLSINLVCYLVFISFLFFLFEKAFKSSLLSMLASVTLGIFNVLMMSQATMLRMYMLLVLETMLLLLCSFKVIERSFEYMNGTVAGSFTKKNIFLFASIAFVGLCGFLTHYDFWIFYGITAFATCFYLLAAAFIRRKKVGLFKNPCFYLVIGYVISFIVALSLTIKLFPYCVWNLNKKNATGYSPLASLFVFTKDKLSDIAWGFSSISNVCVIDAKLLYLVIAAGGIVLIVKKKYPEFAKLALGVLVSILYQTVVSFTLPVARETRYLWCSYTVLLFAFGYSIVEIIMLLKPVIGKRIPIVVVTLVCITLSFMGIKSFDGGRAIPYLFYEDKDVEALKANSEKPWIVYGGADDYATFDFLNAESLIYIQGYEDKEEVRALRELEAAESFVLYVYPQDEDRAIDFISEALGREVTKTYLTRSVNYLVYVCN